MCLIPLYIEGRVHYEKLLNIQEREWYTLSV